MLNMVKKLISEEEGQGMTEYALVLGVIAIGAVVTIGLFRDQVVLLWSNITAKIQAAAAIAGQ